MDPSYVKVDNGKLICCRNNHNEPIVMVVADKNTPIQDMLLCLKCFETKRQVSKYISVQEAQTLIQEKLYKLTNQQEEQKQGILKDLNDFQNKMMNIRSRVIQQIDEILRISQIWITDITNYGRKSDVNNFIQDLQLLQGEQKINLDYLQKSNRSHYKKIDLIVKKLMVQDDYQRCQQILQNIFNINIDQQSKNKIQIIEQKIQNIQQPIILPNINKEEQLKVKNVELISTVKQEESSYAIAFNNTGSIMVAGCGMDIKVWSFEQGKMIEKKKLNGHTNVVSCLVFSKKHNWFASGSDDQTIRCWKKDDKKDWVSTKPGKSHTDCVYCLILNNQEDQLISCSIDRTIKVWKLNCQVNQLEYDQTLEKRHTDYVFCISLNDSETALVSCDGDKRIILWSKEQSDRWIYKHEVIMNDGGQRICFISENQIIWQQCRQGITHLLEQNKDKLIKRSDLNLNLNKGNKDSGLFPTIRNKRRQIIIQKHNRYVYILKQQSNGQLAIVSEPIDCIDTNNFGNLTEDGEHLVIWIYCKNEFRVYNIIYE